MLSLQLNSATWAFWTSGLWQTRSLEDFEGFWVLLLGFVCGLQEAVSPWYSSSVWRIKKLRLISYQQGGE